jgi:hypothetical protein
LGNWKQEDETVGRGGYIIGVTRAGDEFTEIKSGK